MALHDCIAREESAPKRPPGGGTRNSSRDQTIEKGRDGHSSSTGRGCRPGGIYARTSAWSQTPCTVLNPFHCDAGRDGFTRTRGSHRLLDRSRPRERRHRRSGNRWSWSPKRGRHHIRNVSELAPSLVGWLRLRGSLDEE